MVPIMSAAKPQLLAVDDDPAQILDLLRRGLTIVRGVAESHGGHVAVRNSTLGGAEFEIRIPLEPKLR